jgi:carnitine 3-dehydrogenase
MARKAAIIGGGVIGGGWAARFLLNGWDVGVFDPDPEAERKIAAVMSNARAALPALSDVPMPPEGKLTFHGTIGEAVEGAEYVQESVSERIELKHKVYAQLQQANPGVLIGSSTSGFKASDLQKSSPAPENIIVAHPFNPVYLLPLSEISGSPANPPEVVEKTVQIMKDIGMFPLVIRHEIDAFIGNRFLEAVWREALWMLKDGIATTEEIDEAIRMGFGLRWGQMGLFETYRIAGRRGRDAALHGAVRAGAEVALDQADGRARVQRGAGGPGCQPVRRAVRHVWHPRAGAHPRPEPGGLPAVA